MILVRITGGLGNQLFQYAAGLAQAHRLKTNLKLDITEVKSKKYREFLLDRFNIKTSIASKEDLSKFSKISIRKFFLQSTYKEKHFHYDTKFLTIKDNTYIIGFFQSEKYFDGIKDIIKREFTLKNGLSDRSRKFAEKIESLNSVSINIRRGDYITDPIIHKRHGFIGKDYFLKAVNYIKKRTRRPHYFLFSDDIDWVKKNLILENSTYVDINYPDRVEENLILGSLCKHNILTNSTFSWWVGWLNKNKNKIIIAPQKWFNKLKLDTNDLIPKDWHLM